KHPKSVRFNAHRRAAALHRDTRVRHIDARRDEHAYHAFLADQIETDVVGEHRMNRYQSGKRKVDVLVRLVSLDQHIVERQGDELKMGYQAATILARQSAKQPILRARTGSSHRML